MQRCYLTASIIAAKWLISLPSLMPLMSRLPSSQALLRLIKLDFNALLVFLNETFKLVI